MRAELKPQASERKSSGKGDKGHLHGNKRISSYVRKGKAKELQPVRYPSKNLQSLCRKNMAFMVTD